jgi:hypothetical protein
MAERASVQILREHGPMDLRCVTRETAVRLQAGSLMYADVDAVLRAAAIRGEVRVLAERGDYRECVWEAVPASAITTPITGQAS